MDTERQTLHRHSLAILSRGDAAARRDATPQNSRFVRVFEALAAAGIDAQPAAASASKTRTKRLFCGVASRRAAASPRERMAREYRRGGCRSVSMRKLHIVACCAELGPKSHGESAWSPRLQSRRGRPRVQAGRASRAGARKSLASECTSVLCIDGMTNILKRHTAALTVSSAGFEWVGGYQCVAPGRERFALLPALSARALALRRSNLLTDSTRSHP